MIYYGIMVTLGKERLSKDAIIKFAPSIMVGYVVAIVGFLA